MNRAQRRNSTQKKHTNKKRFSYRPLALAIAVAISGTLPNVAHAVEYTVTNTDDSGSGSLREAIGLANASANTSDNIIFDTSTIPPGSSIDLDSELVVTDTLTITGPTAGDAGSIIIAANSTRHIKGDFPANSNKTITLENITLKEGLFASTATTANSGGGGSISLIRANLVLNHTQISDNQVTGQHGTGGGIYLLGGDLTLNQSTVSGNSTAGTDGNGGGIRIRYGDLTLNNSTISDNTSTGNQGGGASIFSGDLTVTQSTVSGNSTTKASGGGGAAFYVKFGDITIDHSTITENTTSAGAGGINTDVFLNDPVNLNNTILSGNTGPLGNFHNRNTNSGSNGQVNVDYSFFGDDLSEITGTNNGTTAGNNDPKLGPLGDFGGPTFTHIPDNDSPVIDLGNDSNSPQYDQRGVGFNRSINLSPATANIDIGATELQTTMPSVVSNNNNSGAGSLRQAVLYTNASAALDTIDLSGLASGSTISLASELFIADSLTISGPIPSAANSLILDAGQNSRHITADFPSNSGKSITLENFTLQNGKTTDEGSGSISVANADLILTNTIVRNNSASGGDTPGGGVSVQYGNLTLNQSTVSNNSTDSVGGGLAVFYGDITLNQSTVSSNSSDGGGGFNVYYGNVILNQSTISDNSVMGNNSSGGGGTIFFGDVTLNQSTVSGNSISGGNYATGAGINVQHGNVTLNQSTIVNNTSNNSTAGVFMYGQVYDENLSFNLNINNSILSDNTVTQTASNIGFDSFINFDGSGSITFNVNTDHSLLGTDVLPVIINDANLVSDVANIDNDNPGLGPLQNNGGPTFTKAPISGSLLIDAGSNNFANNAGFTEDQRGTGFSRIVNNTVDIGAVEAPILPNKNNVVKRAEIVKPILLAAGLEPLATNSAVYDDVAANAFNATWINRFKSEGLTMGCDDTPDRFCPNSTVSKEELAKMIIQVKDINPSTPTGIFSDVPMNAFNADYIETLIDNEFTEGCALSPNRYCPKEAVTIEVFNNILNKAFK